MPSVRLMARPSGKTSTSLPVRSVSGADGGDEESQPDRPGDLDRLGQRGRAVDEHVVPFLDGALVARADAVGAGHQDLAADGRYRLVWVVDEDVGRLGLGRSESRECRRRDRVLAVPSLCRK